MYDLIELKFRSASSYSEAELITLRAVGWLIILLLCVNLSLIAWNIARYFIPLKVNSVLLYMIYVAAAILSFSRIVELIYLVNPANAEPSISNDYSIVQLVFDSLGTLANVALGSVFVATMFTISQSIKMITTVNIDVEKMNNSKRLVYIASAIFYVTFIAVFIFCLCKGDDNQGYSNLYLAVLISSSCILGIAYTVTLFKLNAAMKNLLQNEIETERRSVLYQFTLFIASYLIRTVYYMILLFAFTENLGLVFWWQLLGLLLYIPWNVLPVFYILWCH